MPFHIYFGIHNSQGTETTQMYEWIKNMWNTYTVKNNIQL